MENNTYDSDAKEYINYIEQLIKEYDRLSFRIYVESFSSKNIDEYKMFFFKNLKVLKEINNPTVNFLIHFFTENLNFKSFNSRLHSNRLIYY